MYKLFFKIILSIVFTFQLIYSDDNTRNILLLEENIENNIKNYSVNSGQINLLLSLTIANNFYLHPKNEKIKSNSGLFGICIGIEYFYNSKKSICLIANSTTDLIEFDIIGQYELMTSSSICISDNFKFSRIFIGYGINYSKNTWDLRYSYSLDTPPPTREPIKKTSYSIGFMINCYYQLSKYFYTGLTYQPHLYKINPVTKFQYEHLIRFDVLFKLKLKK